MARGYCPVCDTLQEITTTGQALEYRKEPDGKDIPVGSACFWRPVLHVDRRGEPDDEGRWPLCEGSGRSF